MQIGASQPQGRSGFQCPQQNRVHEVIGNFIRRGMAGNERTGIPPQPRRA